MSSVRRAAVAGRFYAADRKQLEKDVDALLCAAQTNAPCPKVLVAPHAGYIFSGSNAAAGYARLRNAVTAPERVVLLGPAHRVAFRGIAACSAREFNTPLGNVAVDREALDAIAKLPGVQQLDIAHAEEHSLEVHLPFLQRCLGRFRLVPLVVGDASPEQVAAVIEALWGGPETLIVVSTDLSHFLGYDEARDKDAATCRLIEARDATLCGDQACGCRPLNGLLMVLRGRGLDIETVALNNSGDTAGSRDRVVGYGTWVVYETAERLANPPGNGDSTASQRQLSLAQRQQLLHVARSAITHGLDGGGDLKLQIAHYDASLRAQRGSFVTLHHSGALRGCIGSLVATRPLIVDIARNAGSAAFRDPRFQPLRLEEYPGIEVHISVLSPPVPVAVSSRQALIDFLQPGHHGLVLEQGSHRATYLPSVWEKLPDPEQFVSELRAKAGLPRAGWSDQMKVSTYTSEEFC